MSVVSVVCQVGVSRTSWSLVQKSPTDCGAPLCVIYDFDLWLRATRCHKSKAHNPETLCSWSKITCCTFSLENPEKLPQLLGIKKYNHVDGYDQSTLPHRKILFRLIILLYLCLCLKRWALLSWSRNFLLLWSPGIHYSFHKTPPLKRIMNQMNSTNSFTYYSSSILKIILMSTPKSTKWCRIVIFSGQNVCISYLTVRPHMYTRKLVINLIYSYFRQDGEVTWCDFRAVQ